MVKSSLLCALSYPMLGHWSMAVFYFFCAHKRTKKIEVNQCHFRHPDKREISTKIKILTERKFNDHHLITSLKVRIQDEKVIFVIFRNFIRHFSSVP